MGNYGQGMQSFVNAGGSGGGGGTVNGAQNATSIVGNKVELGLNPLLHDTTFDLAEFDLQITNHAGADFALILQSTTGAEEAVLASPGPNTIFIDLKDSPELAIIGNDSTGQQGLLLDFANDAFLMGDINGIFNAHLFASR